MSKNTSYEKQLTVMLPTDMHDKITDKSFKRKIGIPLKEWIAKSIKNTLNEENFLEKVLFMLPQMFEDSFNKSDLSGTLSLLSEEIKPAMDLAQAQAANINIAEDLRLERIKFKIFHLIIIKEEIPSNLVTLQVLQELLDDGYIVRLIDGTYRHSSFQT